MDLMKAAAVIAPGNQAPVQVQADFLFEPAVDTQVGGDAGEAADDGVPLAYAVVPADDGVCERDQHVGDLGVLLIAFAGGGDDDYAPVGIAQDDIGDFADLLCAGTRRSAEFAYFHVVFNPQKNKTGLLYSAPLANTRQKPGMV
jgi:hypothetical protein